MIASLLKDDATLHDLIEEEELIIAVNDLMMNVSRSIKSEFRSDVLVAWTKVTMHAESILTDLSEYCRLATGTRRLLYDLPQIILLFILWFVALRYLLSSSFQKSNGRKANDKTMKTNKTNNGEDDLIENESNKLNSSLSSFTNTDPTTNDEEMVADEDLFEQLWESSIQNSAYSKLVLPPVCRYIRPTVPTTPNLLLMHHRRTPSTTAVVATTGIGPLLTLHRSATSENQTPLSHDVPPRQSSEREFDSRAADDTAPHNYNIADDNPILRLHHYIREIYTLCSFIVSFNYTAAGTTLFRWMYQLYQLHFQQNRNDPPPQPQPGPFEIAVTDQAEFSEIVPLDHIGIQSGKNAHFRKATDVATPTRPCRDSKDIESDEKKDDNVNTEMNRQLYTIPQSPMHDFQQEQNETLSTAVETKSPVFNLQIDHTDLSANNPTILLEPLPLQTQLPSTTQTPERGQMQRFSSDKNQYFDTVTSNESLRQMSIDIPLPDKHGYVLGDEFLADPLRCTPLLVFVNSRSGPQQGNLLITQLRRLLNPIQIWDLSVNGDPHIVLESFLVFSRLRILVCGGDGTVAWIINTMEKMKVSKYRQYPPIAILPLGTGNDLSRILGWGGGYNNESLIVILEQISESYVSLLDQWEVTINEVKNGNHTKHHSTITKGFLNYLGVGADAQAALQVHNLREIRPQWFFSRLVNKAMYGIFGAEDILKATTINVRKDIQLFADGVRVPLPHDSQGIILLNIDSYAGGVPLWSHGIVPPSTSDNVGHGHQINRVRSFSEVEQYCHHPIDKKFASQELLSSMSRDNRDAPNEANSSDEGRFAQVTACDMPCSCQDGYLEIVSIRGAFHLGQIKVGLSNAHRLCQCREAKIIIRNKVAVQVDGEPWRQSTCSITIRRKNEQAVMLHRSADDGGVETEMSKLLEWAEARKMIDSHVHTLLMKEFSRRIESRSRQRRAAAVARQQHDNNNFMNFTSTIKKAISSGAMCTT